MSNLHTLLRPLPTILAGAAVAGAAEMSAGLLLYSTEGFLPALTLILAVEAGALALGLWSGAFQLGEGDVEQVRRRWLFTLVTFAIAAAFSAGMTFVEELLTGGLGQGLGLALLGSLPIFALGSLMGAMSRSGVPVGVGGAVGVPGVAGAAVGFLVTGVFLLPNMAPYTFYLVCLTALSGGALLQGWLLEGGTGGRVLELVWTERGEVKVEDHPAGGGDTGHRVLLEGGRVRGREASDGSPGRAWEKAVVDGLLQGVADPGEILYLGGGSGTLARLVMEEHPGVRMTLVEGTEALVRVAREHFRPFSQWGSVQLLVGEPWSLLDTARGPFSLIIVDGAFLPSLGQVPFLPPGSWDRLDERLEAGGRVILGGIPRGKGSGGDGGSRGDGGSGPSGEDLPLRTLLEGAGRTFPRVTWYQGEREGFALLSGPEGLPRPQEYPGFQALPVTEE